MSESRIAVAVALAVFGLGSVANAAPVLTGVVLFNATSTGAYDASGVAWNTLGGDIVHNLYFEDTVPVFVTSGDGVGASLNLDLTPGSYFFNLYGRPGADPVGGFAGINLFFDGSTIAPGISAYTSIDGAGAPVATNASTLRLSAQALFPGSGTLSFVSAGNTVTLSTFLWNRPSALVGDVVSAFNNVPDGVNDYWGAIRLDVVGAGSAIPEPATFVLVGMALAAFGLRKRR